MEIEESVKKLLEKLNRRHLSTSSTTLYAQQVEAKFKNARYSLHKLKELERPIVVGSGTVLSEPLNNVEKVNFYCDCFWDFLRSSIDILAQLINELTSRTLDERSVDIKRVAQNIDPSLYPQLKTSVDYLLRLTAFNTLEDYRHCSMHRRQVYIETIAQELEILGTRGYDISTDSSTSERKQTRYISHICRNPWDLIPDVDYSRTTATFCEELLKKVEKRMVTIINHSA